MQNETNEGFGVVQNNFSVSIDAFLFEVKVVEHLLYHYTKILNRQKNVNKCRN